MFLFNHNVVGALEVFKWTAWDIFNCETAKMEVTKTWKMDFWAKTFVQCNNLSITLFEFLKISLVPL